MYSRRDNGIYYLTNKLTYNNTIPILFCIHGNCCCAESFYRILQSDIPTIALDLPGCGRSSRLEHYSIEIVAQRIAPLILSFSAPIILFGHSLGSNIVTRLLSILHSKMVGIVIAGCPLLACPEDFTTAFTPDNDARELIHYLIQSTAFTDEQAHRFIKHTFVALDSNIPKDLESIFDIMVSFAKVADPKFKQGCFSTIDKINNRAEIEKYTKVIIFHAENDGIINATYLNQVNKNCLFNSQIYYLPCRHMIPLLEADKVIEIIKKAYYT
jgi:pimeloyl-ACP methyl ester carboxylesterase